MKILLTSAQSAKDGAVSKTTFVADKKWHIFCTKFFGMISQLRPVASVASLTSLSLTYIRESVSSSSKLRPVA